MFCADDAVWMMQFVSIFQIKVEQSHVSSCTLWLSVWDWDTFGRNQFLGEIRLLVSSLDLTRKQSQWYTLQDEVLVVLGTQIIQC